MASTMVHLHKMYFCKVSKVQMKVLNSMCTIITPMKMITARNTHDEMRWTVRCHYRLRRAHKFTTPMQVLVHRLPHLPHALARQTTRLRRFTPPHTRRLWRKIRRRIQPALTPISVRRCLHEAIHCLRVTGIAAVVIKTQKDKMSLPLLLEQI